MTYKIFGEELDIYVCENFLSEKELSILDREISRANTLNLWANPEGNTTEVDTWNGRTFFPEVPDVIHQIYNKIVDFYGQNIRDTKDMDLSSVFTGLGPINRTKVGECLPAHDDLGPPELNAPVEYGVVLYLNEDFVGGELYYSEKNLELPPKRGMLVIHPSTKEYTHGVREVTEGVRYGLTMFLNDPRKVKP